MTAPPMSHEEMEDRRRRGRSNLTWVLLVGTFLLVIAAPTMVVMFFGMLPTLVAYIIDRSPQKSATFSVGAVNFIGVFPYVMELWTGVNSIDQALNLVTDIFAMLVMYASAAFGWLLFMAMPTVVSSFVIVLQQRKIAQLRAEQKELIEEWGAEVAALVELARVDAKEEHMEFGGHDFDVEHLEDLD